jgi:pyruvate dehydrogenase E2 component (dihydrolipoamide acetyltransferase)
MTYEFRLPDIGEGVAEGEVVKWFVREGETVQEDAPLVSVLTDKANVEIPSPKGGKVLKLHAKEGEKVKVGGLLVTLDAPGGGEPTPAPAAAAEGPATAGSAAASPGPPPSNAGSAVAAESAPSRSAPTPPARVLASPYLRRLAAERNLDLSKVKGSGPGGRITEADLSPQAAAIAEAPGESKVPAGPKAPGPDEPRSTTSVPAGRPESPTPAPSAGSVERIPLRGVRRAIAEHMALANQRAALYTYVEEVDASELVRVRDRMAKHVEKQGPRLTYLPFVLKGVVAGLREHPWVNATMDDEKQELVVHREYHIGIATAAPDGLLVPVIRNVDRKSVSQLAKEIQELSERGRAGKLGRAEMVGGSFTITSLGALGGVLATPIVNYPEVAILGVHRIVRRPVYRPDGSVGPADLMNLSVSLDHRVLDGIVGAQFLAVVKSYLEDPHQLFAELA